MKGEFDSLKELIDIEEQKAKWYKTQLSRKDTIVKYARLTLDPNPQLQTWSRATF